MRLQKDSSASGFIVSARTTWRGRPVRGIEHKLFAIKKRM